MLSGVRHIRWDLSRNHSQWSEPIRGLYRGLSRPLYTPDRPDDRAVRPEGPDGTVGGQRVRQSRSAWARYSTRRGGAREKRAERPFRGQIKRLERRAHCSISSNDDLATWCKIIITATIMIVSLWHCSNLIIIIIIIIITLITPALFHFFTEIIIIIKTVAVCTVQCRFGGKNDPFGTFFKLYLSKIQKKLKIFSLQISFIILYITTN